MNPLTKTIIYFIPVLLVLLIFYALVVVFLIAAYIAGLVMFPTKLYRYFKLIAELKV